MATTNADFKVKKGLQIEGGDIHLGTGQDGSLSTDNRSGTNLIGRHLSVVAGTGTGNAVGGRIDFYTGGAAGSSGTSATTSTQVLRMNSDGQSAFYGNLSLSDNNLTDVGDINADSISVDGASTGLNVDFSGANTGTGVITLGDNLASALDIKEGSTSYLKFTTTNSSEAIVVAKPLDINSTSDFGSNAMTNVNIDSGAIDGTVIGANSAAAGTFGSVSATTFSASSWAKINGSARETNSMLQVNGPSLSGSSGDTTMNYAEARIHTDIANDDVSGTTYNGLGNALVLDNAENIHVGQATIYTQGRSGSGNSWAIGRQANRAGASSEAAANIFHIGYFAKDYDNVANSTDNPLNVSNYLMTLDTSGTAKFKGDIILDDGGSLKEAGGTAALTFDASGNITKIGQDTPSTNQVLTWDSSGYAVWSASASGADGMGSGFVLEDGDGTEVTIDEDKEVKFIDGDGILINWTDTSTGSDGDPYDLTFSLNIDGMTDIGAGLASGDLFIVDDGAGGTNRKTTVDRIATLLAGAGLTATNAVIAVDADQSSQITAVGTLTGLTVSGAADLNNNLTVDGATISLDATTSLNIDNSNTSNGITIGTATSGVPISIGHTTSETTINDNLTVTGDLTVNGTTTTVNSTTLTFDDKNIELAHSPSGSEGNDSAVDGGGITLKSSDSDKTFNWVDATDAWTSSEHLNLLTGKKFMINGTAVFESNTELTSTVVTSGLTTVGALNSGSITSGFGSINNGSSAITTTGTITGGVLVADNLQLDGNVLSSTNTNGNITLTPNGSGLVNIAKDDLAIAGTAVTTTAAELNVLDNVTAGTVSASLGVVVDSNKDIGSFRNVTATGTIQGGILSADAVAIVDSSRGASSTITGETTLATYDVSSYTTAKYVYQIKKDGTVDTDVGEILVTYEGTSNDVFLTEYAMLSTGSSIGAWTADYNSGDTTVRLRFTPTSNGAHTYSIMNTLLIT